MILHNLCSSSGECHRHVFHDYDLKRFPPTLPIHDGEERDCKFFERKRVADFCKHAEEVGNRNFQCSCVEAKLERAMEEL